MSLPSSDSEFKAPYREAVDAIRYGFVEPVPLDNSSPAAFMASFLARYEYAPVLFVQEVFGETPDDWQNDVLCDVAAGERNISIRSGHGVGKSKVLSWAAIWFLFMRFRCKVVLTAPTAAQLFDALMAEIKSLFQRVPAAMRSTFEVKSDHIVHCKYPEDCFLSARTSSRDRPEALQGVHSDFVLLIADEASGVDDAVFNAAGGSMQGPNRTMMLTGNPTRLRGRFANSHRKVGYRENFRRYHIGPHNSPRITAQYVREVADEHGLESNEYRVRVLGEFPLTDDDSYISAAAVEAAMERNITTPKHTRPVWAVDPARFGRDRSAMGERKGPVVTWVKAYRNLDTMSLVGAIKSEYDKCEPGMEPVEILIDVIGIGAGVADRARELGLPVREINVSESAVNPLSKCMRLRDELWKNTKEVLSKVKLPDDEDILTDLTLPGFQYSSDGRLKIESKEKIKSRGEGSPDKGDVVCMLLGAADMSAVYAAELKPYGASKTAALRRNVGAVR